MKGRPGLWAFQSERLMIIKSSAICPAVTANYFNNRFGDRCTTR